MNSRDEKNLAFEAIAKSHDVASFQCGKKPLDNYLLNNALRDHKAGIAAVYILTPNGRDVIGYFTLHQASIDASEIPESLKKRLSLYREYPATLIGRMAVDRRYQGKGFGRDLLLEAVSLALDATRIAASWALIIDPLDQEATSFYTQNFGFIALDSTSGRLCMPMVTARALLEASGFTSVGNDAPSS